jgi:hypothetical protein
MIKINSVLGVYNVGSYIWDSNNNFLSSSQSVDKAMISNTILGYISLTSDTSTNLYFDSLIVDSTTNANNFQVALTSPYTTNCTYNNCSGGVCNSYFYYNIDNSANLINYKTFTIIPVNTMKPTTTTTIISGIPIETVKKPKMTLEEKHTIWAYSLTFGLAIIIALMLGIFSSRNANAGGVALLGFLIVIAIGLVFFGSIGWITAIYAIIIGLFDIIFIIFTFKYIFFSTAE